MPFKCANMSARCVLLLIDTGVSYYVCIKWHSVLLCLQNMTCVCTCMSAEHDMGVYHDIGVC